MTADGCRRYRELLGAYLLGQLSPTEPIALEAHLDGCADCSAELADLRPVTGALSSADPAHLGSPPAPPAELGDRVFAGIRDARSARRRRRWLVRSGAGIAAAAVALSLAIALRPAPSVKGDVVAFLHLPPGVQAEATLYKRNPGIEVWLQVAGLTPGATYNVWVERASGERVRCGSFDAVMGRSHVVLPSTVDYGDATAIGVSTAGGKDVMRAPITSHDQT